MSWLSALCDRIFCHVTSTIASSSPRSLSYYRRHTSVDHDANPHTSTSPASAPGSSNRPEPLNLLSLPDDVLLEIVRHATHCSDNNRSPGALHVVEHRSFKASAALAAVSQKTATLFYASLDNICLASAQISDPIIESISRRAGPSLKRLVLRGCTSVTNASLHSLARHASTLRSLDLSFLSHISHDGLKPLCNATHGTLRHLLLRECAGVNDAALRAIARCSKLETLDLSYCTRVTDRGMEVLLYGAGAALRLLALAHNDGLTDNSLISIGRYCKSLVQLCARAWPLITDHGFERLCAGVGCTVEGIDVTQCPSLTRNATLHTLSRYCDKIYAHVKPKFASRTLQQIIISTLRQNIFIVHGSDPVSGKNTVHTVLIDNGDLVSASLLTSGTTDLSKLGIVLCKSYGSALNEETKQMLEKDYGIPSTIL